MRYVLCAVLTVCCCVPAAAQGVKKEEKKEDKKESKKFEIYEIGGKDLKHWITEIHSVDPSRRENAMRTVLLFGPDKAYQAVPALLAELKKHQPSSPVDLSARLTGADVLCRAVTAVKEPDPKYIKEAVSIYRVLLRDNQAEVRIMALRRLPFLGPECKSTLPLVIELVGDPDTWATRQAAVQTLVAMAADPKNLPEPKVFNALLKRLQYDKCEQVRLQALQGLAILGKPGEMSQKEGLINDLRKATSIKEPVVVQIGAHLAIMTVKNKLEKEHLKAIAKFLRDEQEVMLRAQAAQALSMSGLEGGPIVGPDLIYGLNDPDDGVVATCILGLLRMEYLGAVKALQKLADESTRNDELKQAARNAAYQIQNAERIRAKEKAEKTK
jgi:hypothetical protein